ncbi:MAG TPA: hypothetical protein IAA29_11725 [Candidatus Paenibacillus intestinavium]|nr:hypothetical protein [Candidatus Paenibacillus intestinavium]
MYFPLLRNLSKYQIEPVAINLLDSWLAIQRSAILRNLSPLRFSVQSGIDVDLAIDMFALSSSSDIPVLKPIYKVLCPNCDGVHQNVYIDSEIPQHTINCRFCEYEFIPINRQDYIEIVFERILTPAKSIHPTSSTTSFEHRVGNVGKSDSLRASDINKNSNHARRLLFDALDSRYEAAQ